jgi:hypothetical protein
VSSLPDIIPPATGTESDNQSAQYYWQSAKNSQLRQLEDLPEQLRQIDVPFSLVEHESDVMIALGGSIHFSDTETNDNKHNLLAVVSKQEIISLGDRQFCQDYGIPVYDRFDG